MWRRRLGAVVVLACASGLSVVERRTVGTRRGFVAGGVSCLIGGGAALPATALVKGSVPPPRGEAREKRTCKDMAECEAQGEARAEVRFFSEASAAFETTPEGVRYRDVLAGDGREAAPGDAVTFKYRVMRLGKRSSDSLSGEASPVFSLGYGEDDDSEKDVLRATLGRGDLIEALDSAMVGMRPGGRRRLFVVPERGWKKINSSCSASTNGASNSGEANAGAFDLIGQAVVPLAEVINNDACIETTRQPQPRNFGAKRRLARRFDEGLLVEVDLVK